LRNGGGSGVAAGLADLLQQCRNESATYMREVSQPGTRGVLDTVGGTLCDFPGCDCRFPSEKALAAHCEVSD